MTFISDQIPNYFMISDDCFGNDLENHRNLLNAVDCADRCSPLSACVGFVWAPGVDPNCFLKHTVCPFQSTSPFVRTYFKNGR